MIFDENVGNYTVEVPTAQNWDDVYYNASSVIINEGFNLSPEDYGKLTDEICIMMRRMAGNLEIAKMSASIGATSHKRNDCELFHSGEHLQGGISTPKMSLLATIPSTITSDYLSKIWSIDEDLAAGAINHNTHLYRRSAENDLSRQLSTNDRMLCYRRINSSFFTDTFYVTKKGKSV